MITAGQTTDEAAARQATDEAAAGQATAEMAGRPLAPSPSLTVGFIGLGAMGGRIARNLRRAGYRVVGYDLDSARVAACTAAGVAAAGGPESVVDASEVVLTSLPSSDSFVSLAESVLLPRARAGHVFVDVGTVTPPDTRRLAAAFAERGATLIDAPVSGGPSGAELGALLVFAGGDPDAVERCRPILDVLGGNGGRITYCGPAGCGQVVKGVNQLAMGLGNAAFLEAISFGINAGVDPETIGAAVGGESGWRAIVAAMTRRIAAGKGDEIGVKFRELPYFLREAQEAGFPLPLTALLYHVCDRSERVVIDDNRPAPSFFRELTGGDAGD